MTSILFREDADNTEEKSIAEKICDQHNFVKLYNYRTQIPNNELVIGRYSVLPFYKELEQELKLKGCKLINTYTEHQYIADVMAWYQDIPSFTPATWTTWAHLEKGPWVVKGKTNSRKFQWNTLMFAENREQLIDVIRNLMIDPLIREQGVVVREYVPLKKLDESINGLPVSAEWRCFFYKEEMIASGFYWSTHEDCAREMPEGAFQLAKTVAKIISQKATFFVIDVAEKQDGGFIVIEINDGQMSGLSMIDPQNFYERLLLCVRG